MNVRLPRLSVFLLLSFAVPLAAQLTKPQITSIYPPGGPLAGGTNVTIRGTNFQYGATAYVGNVALTNVNVTPPSTITGTTGARANAIVANVAVINPNGGSSSLVRAFTQTDVTCCLYPSFALTPLTGGPSSAASVCLGDFTGAYRDIVAVTNGSFALYGGDGTADLTPAQTFTATGNLAGTERWDVNGDNADDVAIAPLGGAITTYLGDDSAPFTSTRSIPSTAYAVALDSGDFNNDGVPDLVIPDLEYGNVSICLGVLGGSGCAATSVYSAGTSAAGVVVGHFNGDAHLDFAVSDEPSGTVTVFLGNGTGSFAAGDAIPAGTCTTGVMGLATGFFDGDNLVDLAVATGAILLGNNDGTFDAATPLAESDGRHVVTADFNRDGKIDVAIDNSLSSVRIMLGDGAGGFTPGPTIDSAAGLYDAFAIFDIEGDGMVDLALGGSPAVARNTVTTCPTITLSPASLPDGTADQSYIADVTQSGGLGAVTFSLEGTLPNGLSFFGGTISGTPVQVGTFTVTVTATDANGCKGQRQYALDIFTAPIPSGLVATANGIASVQLSWIGVANADYYQVVRSPDQFSGSVIASPTGTSYTDNAVEAGKTYRYTVRAVFNAQPTSDSLPDIATTIAFEDDPLFIGTVVKAVHLTELRTAVNLVRAAAGLGAASVTNPDPTGVAIKAVHLSELRTALNAARTILGVPGVSLPGTFAVGAVVRAADFKALRNGVK